MAQYTLTIKQLIENEVDIFKFNYPIFEESYRPILEQNIINHYYFDEIGQETAGRFIHHLKSRLNEIMPYYNKMYETDRLKYDPLSNYDVTEIIKEIGEGSQNESGNSATKRLNSDTPQGRLTIGENYVSEIEEVENNGINTSTSRGNKDITRTMKGNIGVQTSQELIMKYRETFTRLDSDIIQELRDLFMLVY